MPTLLLWGLVLLAVAVVLMAIELFIPTAGVVTALSLISTLAGLVFLFKFDTLWGTGGLLGVAVLWPMIFITGLRIWRNTPAGRRVIGIPTDEEQEKTRAQADAERKRLSSLLNAQGTVVTDLRPLGVIEIGGKRYDASSETSFIKAGSRIRVTVAEPNLLRVRPLN